MAGTSQAMTAERLMTWGVREGGASRLSPGNDEGWAWHTISIRHGAGLTPRIHDAAQVQNSRDSDRCDATWFCRSSPAMTAERLDAAGFLLPAALQRRVRHVYVSGCGGRQMDEKTRTELEAAVYRRLVEHLRSRTDVQNIDMMNLAGFCAIASRTG
jgi:hypothetical protein